jgi:small membrane protein
MIRIQALLILLLAAGAGVYVVRLHATLAARLMVLGVAFCGAALVAWPAGATALAGLVGVGRGVDLIIYLALLAQGFLLLLLFSALRELRSKLAEVTRELALASANRDCPISRELNCA